MHNFTCASKERRLSIGFTDFIIEKSDVKKRRQLGRLFGEFLKIKPKNVRRQIIFYRIFYFSDDL